MFVGVSKHGGFGSFGGLVRGSVRNGTCSLYGLLGDCN